MKDLVVSERPINPRVLAGLAKGRARSNFTRNADRQEGLAYARAWRARRHAEFDALFSPEPRCQHCGGLIDER